MRIAVLALALLPAAAIAEERDPPVPSHFDAARKCENASTQIVRGAPQPVRPQTLRDQPLADQYLGVLRLEDGCDKPVKIREDIGRLQR